MLSEGQLRVLGAVTEERSVKQLADELGYGERYTHELTTELAELDLLGVKRRGRKKYVEPMEATPAVVYRDLVVEKPYIDFADLFGGSMIAVLYALDEPRTAVEIATHAGLSRSTATRRLKHLANRGMVTQRHGEYELRTEYARFNEFATALVRHEHRVRLRAVTAHGSLVWVAPDAFLARTSELVDDSAYHQTGLDRLADYGLEFHTTSARYYLWTEGWAPSAVDIACHLLLIDDDSRMRKYTTLFVTHEGFDEGDLLERAAYYGVESRMSEIVTYLETNGEQPPGYPPWPEFERLAAEYEVAV